MNFYIHLDADNQTAFEFMITILFTKTIQIKPSPGLSKC